MTRPTTAVIGTGAIGSAVTHRLLAAGHDVIVWNRTPERTAPLVAAGARAAGSVAAAAGDADLVLLTLTGHAAVRDCLAGVTGPLPGTTIVTMCTGTPEEARATAARVAEIGGAAYLDAGVQASPDDVAAGKGTILYGGTGFDAHAETLGLFGTPRFVGAAPDAAAVWDLALFGVWYDAQLGLLRGLHMVRAAGIDVAEFAATAATQLGYVVDAAGPTAAELAGGSYPAGPATLAEHLPVVRQLIRLREGSPVGGGGLAEAAARIEALIAAGREGEGLTATVG